MGAHTRFGALGGTVRSGSTEWQANLPLPKPPMLRGSQAQARLRVLAECEAAHGGEEAQGGGSSSMTDEGAHGSAYLGAVDRADDRVYDRDGVDDALMQLSDETSADRDSILSVLMNF